MKSKSVVISSLFTLFSFFCNGQEAIESIDKFFLNIPIRKEFNQWVIYVGKDSMLGIDSVRNNIVSSTIRNKEFFSHNPLMQGEEVRVFLSNKKFKLLYPKNIDSIQKIIVISYFSFTKGGRLASKSAFKECIKIFAGFYKRKSGLPLTPDMDYYFFEGDEAYFPDITLSWRITRKEHNFKAPKYYTLSLIYEKVF